MEEYELTDPEVIPEVITNKYKVVVLFLDWKAIVTLNGEPGLVSIDLTDNNGKPINCRYEGKTATDLMKWLNTANFSVNSMHKRILQKLSTDGKLPPGNVTGTPDPPVVLDV